jgi:transglutaminase-like putative cysteine protease
MYLERLPRQRSIVSYNLRLWPVAVAAILLLPASLHAQGPYSIGPSPAWVKQIHPDMTSPPPQGNVTYGYELLLVDRQESVTAAGLERFKHLAYRLLDERAVEDNSQIELTFDPTYEQLVLHAVSVTRNGRTIDQLKPDRIRVVARESEADYQVFDGSRSLVIVLENVKRGDVIEYSFTRRGANPVFAGHFMETVSLQESVPTRELYFRLLWPRDRPLAIRRNQTTVEPSVAALGAQREYLWTANNIPAKVLDVGLPDWYEPYPGVQLSDFTSWHQVAAWGDSLFASPGPLPSVLTARVATIRRTSSSKEAQVLAALRYVQDEVRYLGVEIGVNSHMPYPVATVIRRDYGDCKDKAQLLVVMLRELGIPARPALVSTTYKSHIRDIGTTASEFDHAIVETQIDGREYWLDPTALYQRGDLNSVGAPFGSALVLAPETDSLTTIPKVQAADPVTNVTITFDLAEVGKPASMRVETEYRGRAADDVRETIRSTSIEKLQREYTEFYTGAYPGITSEALPQIEDDETANVVHTTEWYTIASFWHQSADQQGYLGTFDPVELGNAIPSLTASARTMPLAVDYPVNYRYTITAHLLQGWGIEARTDTIHTSAVRFVRSILVNDQSLTLNYEYETLADHVEPASAADHLDQLSRLRRLLIYSVTPPTTAASTRWSDPREINWTVLLIGLFTTGLAVVGAIRIHRSPPPAWPPRTESPGDELNGLRGWLSLVGVIVSVMPVLTGYTLIKNASIYTASSWAQHTTPGAAAYHPLWAPTLLLELVGNIVLLVFACLQAWQFFHRSRWFPALFVSVSIARLALEWADVLIAEAIPAVRARGVQWSRHELSVVAVALWVGYMFRSRRVRNTFVN